MSGEDVPEFPIVFSCRNITEVCLSLGLQFRRRIGSIDSDAIGWPTYCPSVTSSNVEDFANCRVASSSILERRDGSLRDGATTVETAGSKPSARCRAAVGVPSYPSFSSRSIGSARETRPPRGRRTIRFINFYQRRPSDDRFPSIAH